MVLRVRGVIAQGRLRQGHLPTEVLEVVLEVEALIEVRGAPEAVNPIGILHQEVATIVLQEVKVQEVAEAIEVRGAVPEVRAAMQEVPVVVPEVRGAAQEVLAALQDHHLVVGHLQVEVVEEDNNSQS